MALERIIYKTRAEWLNGRKGGIGASDAAAAAGLSPWKQPWELWEEITGKRQPKDISEIEYVKLGHRAEPHIRGLFMAEHPEFELEYNEFGILYQTERPWLRATLDGELTEKDTGRKGVLEIKTGTLTNKMQWQAWDGKIPQYYYCQVLHQLLATGYEFAVLRAYLKRMDGDAVIKNYEFDRKDAQIAADMDAVLAAETEFWESVKAKKEPAHTLPTPDGWQ